MYCPLSGNALFNRSTLPATSRFSPIRCSLHSCRRFAWNDPSRGPYSSRSPADGLATGDFPYRTAYGLPGELTCQALRKNASLLVPKLPSELPGTPLLLRCCCLALLLKNSTPSSQVRLFLFALLGLGKMSQLRHPCCSQLRLTTPWRAKTQQNNTQNNIDDSLTTLARRPALFSSRRAPIARNLSWLLRCTDGSALHDDLRLLAASIFCCFSLDIRPETFNFPYITPYSISVFSCPHENNASPGISSYPLPPKHQVAPRTTFLIFDLLPIRFTNNNVSSTSIAARTCSVFDT